MTRLSEIKQELDKLHDEQNEILWQEEIENNKKYIGKYFYYKDLDRDTWFFVQDQDEYGKLIGLYFYTEEDVVTFSVNQTDILYFYKEYVEEITRDQYMVKYNEFIELLTI